MLIYLEIKKEIYQIFGFIKYNNMSWETNVITQISFSKETYDSMYKVKDAIDFCNKRIQDIVNKLMVYSTSRPQDILLNRGEATLETIQEEVEDMIELLEEYFVKRSDLEALKDNFKCVDGDYIDNPNRKENVKKWLIDNYILDKSDFSSVNNTNNTQINDIKPIDINAIEGD